MRRREACVSEALIRRGDDLMNTVGRAVDEAHRRLWRRSESSKKKELPFVQKKKKSYPSPKRQHLSEISTVEKKSNGIHIPLDLTLVILSRLPVKSLVSYHKYCNMGCDGFVGYDPVEDQVFTLLGGPKKQQLKSLDIQAKMNQLNELTLVNYKGKLGCIRHTEDSAEMWIMEDHHKKKQEWSKIIPCIPHTIIKILGFGPYGHCFAGVTPYGEIVIIPKRLESKERLKTYYYDPIPNVIKLQTLHLEKTMNHTFALTKNCIERYVSQYEMEQSISKEHLEFDDWKEG
ncbi:PREDICTED: putative F-box protein At1g33010 [Brassica oleracea var. oleracea]|uniref:putative F-box protein At1g33010 n=1 Tax=Brassica oleracea var. oleracea TaxID=109376 RepID=UPI0006A74838|nr:PREDICTED: putative F-box protein At1g33010 [Brassica oleracea var. oleracea]